MVSSKRVWLASLALSAGLHTSIILPGFHRILNSIKPMAEQIQDVRHYNRRIASMSKEEFLNTLEKDMADASLDSMSFADFFLRAESYYYSNDRAVFIAASDRYYKMLDSIRSTVDGMIDPIEKALAIHRLVNIIYHKKYKEEAGILLEDIQSLEWNCGSKTHGLVAFMIDAGVPRGLLGVRGFTDPHQQPVLWTKNGWLDLSIIDTRTFRETRERVHPVHILVASYLREQGRKIPEEYAELWRTIKPKEGPLPNNKARGLVANDIPAERRLYKNEQEFQAANAINKDTNSSSLQSTSLPSTSLSVMSLPPSPASFSVDFTKFHGLPWLPALLLHPMWTLDSKATMDDMKAVFQIKLAVLQLRQILNFSETEKNPSEPIVQLIDIDRALDILTSIPARDVIAASRTVEVASLAEFYQYLSVIRESAEDYPKFKKWEEALGWQVRTLLSAREVGESFRHDSFRPFTSEQTMEKLRSKVYGRNFRLWFEAMRKLDFNNTKLTPRMRENINKSMFTFAMDPDLAPDEIQHIDPAEYANIWPEFLQRLFYYNPGIFQRHPVLRRVMERQIESIEPAQNGEAHRAARIFSALVAMEPLDPDLVVKLYERFDSVPSIYHAVSVPILYGVMDRPQLLYDPRIRTRVQRVIASPDYEQMMDDAFFAPYFAEVLRETEEL